MLELSPLTANLTGSLVIEEKMEQFLLVISAALVVATLPSLIPWFRKIPYTLFLVIVGMGLSLLDIHFFTPSPALILWIFLPPLLFEAAWNINWNDLKKLIVPVVLYDSLGVVITILVVAYALVLLTPLNWVSALLVGACVSATDPVAVSSLLRELGAPAQLKTLVEGESMFNDGTAVLAFSLLIGIAGGTETFELQAVIVRFFAVVGIGLAVGLLMGFGIALLTKRFDLPLVEQSLTLVAAYSAYLIAEALSGSGVIATVTVGLILGNYGARVSMNPRTRIITTEFWEFVSFFVNSILFLLIGDQLQFQTRWLDLEWIIITIAAVLISRLIAVYGLTWISNRFTRITLDLPTQTMLWWAGLRGGVSIALALSLPADLPDRRVIITLVFSVVLFTILVQGLTTKFVLEALGLVRSNPLRDQYLELNSREIALQRMLDYLQQPSARIGVSPQALETQKATLQQQLAELQTQTSKLVEQDPSLTDVGLEQLQDALLLIETNTYAELVKIGRLEQELPPLLEPATPHVQETIERFSLAEAVESDATE